MNKSYFQNDQLLNPDLLKVYMYFNIITKTYTHKKLKTKICTSNTNKY